MTRSLGKVVILVSLALLGCLEAPASRPPAGPAAPTVSARTTYAELFEELAYQVEAGNITTGAELIQDAGGALDRAGLVPPANYNTALKPFIDAKTFDKSAAAAALRSLKR